MHSADSLLLARCFLPKYEQDEKFREIFYRQGCESSVSPTPRGENASATYSGHERLLPDEASHSSPYFHCIISVHRDEMRTGFSRPHISAAVVKTLTGILHSLSNQSLTDTGRETLASIIEAPAWDTVLPHLREVVTGIDSKIVQAIAEGLLKESIRTCHHRMLELSLILGMDPTQRIKHFEVIERRIVLCTPLVALCNGYSKKWPFGLRNPSPESLIRSLLKRDSRVSRSTLLWIIRAGFHAIAEDVIHDRPELIADFAIAVSDLEDGSWLSFDTFDPVTPLLVACSDVRPSAEKLSLIRCLLERNAKADLEAMIAAAGTCDRDVISILHQHGAPVNGFIDDIGSPLLSACKAALRSQKRHYTDLATISHLLRLGASPYTLDTRDSNNWENSPLHILARAEEGPAVKEALDLLIKNGDNINHRARFYQLESYRCMLTQDWIRPYGNMAETALEYAVESSRWTSAVQLLSAGCELTGREILFINSDSLFLSDVPEELGQERFKSFIRALLAKAPRQAAAIHWNGLTVLQRAIQEEHDGMILALLEFGVRPTPSDFLYMLCNRIGTRAQLCRLSSAIQMKLVLDARLSEPPITDARTVRLILSFSSAETVRYILNDCPDVYDSEGLCYLVARLLTEDKISYIHTNDHVDWERRDQRFNGLNIEDLRAFISRRTISNTHEDWESTAVTITAHAGRVDILRVLVKPSHANLLTDGLIPLFLLKEFLAYDMNVLGLPHAANGWNLGRLGVWIRYCRMDDPNMRCSPLTAAAMVVPETAAEEVFDMLLALNYQPDCWTVLVASCQGRLFILQRLKRLECWPHILNHTDRPGWCPTALQAAVYNSHVNTVKFLLNIGNMIDFSDQPPCQPFCYAGPDEVHAPDSLTILPKTALQHAVDTGNMELVTLLVDSGADVNAPAAMDSGATALQIAAIQGYLPMMQYLISQGADPHAAGAAKHGRTALQGAAEHGRKDTVELLLGYSQSTTCWHREELVEAVFYAEKNVQHVVASILREKLVPEFNAVDDETLEILWEEWESSSEHSAVHELRNEFEDWEETFEDLPEALRAYGKNSKSGASREGPDIENTVFVEQDDFLSLPEVECGLEANGNFDVPWNSDADLLDVDLANWLSSYEVNEAWIDNERLFEGYGVDETVPHDFLMWINVED